MLTGQLAGPGPYRRVRAVVQIAYRKGNPDKGHGQRGAYPLRS
jgi:hypothetical protein